ncbi:hypothetical protein G5T42_12530 [Microbacterium sp. 4R-513]|uniref:hypothetical protein n=1 Tax=Microbacterium sp. 4R-513 TaxID=2567934 RepID=UPI0013E20632|nr:hypothetical protein [Microbacterium sp. 4R-513]QIG40206.1 hypothetical protein G5T42_12530 [Microbacterium sp. 4R-513]
MVRTWDGGTVAVEVCPICSSLQVRVVEPEWFLVELERSDELRPREPLFVVEFACRDCGSRWR